MAGEGRALQPDLSEALRVMHEVFDSVLDAMLIVDDAGNYVDVNTAACTLFGVPREGLLQRNVHQLGGCHLSGASAWHDFLRDGRSAGHFRLLRADGEYREVGYRATAHILPNLHLSVLRDLTERRAGEPSSRRAEKGLEPARKTEAVSTLAARVAHDFNNLLSIIMTNTVLVIEALEPDDPSLADLEAVRGAAEQAAGLTRQLLALGRQQDT